MAEALSRSEVESLLSALNPAQANSSRVSVEHSSALGQPLSSSELARRVVGLFERFRHAMASATADMLPEPARLKRHMPVRVPFSELRNRLDENGLLLLAESKQSGGDLLAILDRGFAIALVSCMLGQGELPDQPHRETLSPLEERLLLRWLQESLEGIVDPELWEPVEFEPVNSDHDLAAYHAQSPWWCEVWELKAQSLRGRIELCGAWEFFSSLTGDSERVKEQTEQAEPEAPESIPNQEVPTADGYDQTSEI